MTRSACCVLCRYTKDIPQTGSTSGTDGKPVIFPYIDLNIQTLQGNNQLRSSAAAAPAGYGQQPAAASASMPSVTPGRPGASAVRAPAGVVPDGMVARLSEALQRIASAGQNLERVSATADGSRWQALRACCMQDSLAMVRVWQRLPIEALQG